jgi:hypothetical protein
VVESCIKEIEKSYKSKYPMDGIVFKIYDKEHYNSLGSTAHHPKGAIAFKFQNVTAESKLLDVEYGIGKENITATAIFETVNLNGVNISRASIPMKSKTLPCIINGDFKKGDIVVVEKAGDVIPHIIEIKSNNGEVFTLNKCPFCGSEIEFTDSSVKCTNINCRKKQIHKLYESLVLLGINNIGETTVDILSKYILEKNNLEINVNNWMKEFSSDKNINIINKMENFGEISANNIINETKKIKNIDLSQFIASLLIGYHHRTQCTLIRTEFRKQSHSVIFESSIVTTYIVPSHTIITTPQGIFHVTVLVMHILDVLHLLDTFHTRRIPKFHCTCHSKSIYGLSFKFMGFQKAIYIGLAFFFLTTRHQCVGVSVDKPMNILVGVTQLTQCVVLQTIHIEVSMGLCILVTDIQRFFSVIITYRAFTQIVHKLGHGFSTRHYLLYLTHTL